MPPKDFMNTDSAKIAIRDANGELVETTASLKICSTLETIESIKSVDVKTYNLRPIKFVVRISAKLRNKTRLFQVLGVLRPPKLTYKTNMEYVNRRRYNGHKRPKKH